MMSSRLMGLMTAMMMAAMMLPSFAPALWQYHASLRRLRAPWANRQTALFAICYIAMWSFIGLAMYVVSSMTSPLAPEALGAALLCAGMLQRSAWKARRLLRCGDVCASAMRGHRAAGLRDGYRFGADCALSCAAPMAVLFVAGLMNLSVMLSITAAITAERVAPGGHRVARWTGTLALIAGSLVCVRAMTIT